MMTRFWIILLLFIWLSLSFVKPIFFPLAPGAYTFLRERSYGKALACILGMMTLIVLVFLNATAAYNLFMLKPYTESIDSTNKANKIINSGEAFTVIYPEDSAKVLAHYRDALAHAKKMNINFLCRKHKGWGECFEREYLAGLQLYVSGYEEGNISMMRIGQRKMRSWGEWLETNSFVVIQSVLPWKIKDNPDV